MYKQKARQRRAGFPEVYEGLRQRVLKGWLKILSGVGLITGLLAYLSIYHNAPLLLTALSGGLFTFLAISSIGSFATDDAIVLYFEQEVPGDWFTGTVRINRHCRTLDDLACMLNVTPLSTFGFADDLCGEPVTWHTSEEGLRTVSVLLTKLRKEPQMLPKGDALVADLTKMQERLQHAVEVQSRFCLIFHANVMSSPEIEQRKGHF